VGRTHEIPPKSPWVREPELVDESSFTWWGQGWHSWNDRSPELEFCELAAQLTRLIVPSIVVETGVGQGFMTRRVAAQLGPEQRLLCFESSPRFRAKLERRSFFDGKRITLAPQPTPDAADLAGAELTILDSTNQIRSDELGLWWQVAPPGATLLVHDASNRHADNTPHARMARFIDELGIPGVFLKNPRGGFLGSKPR
jgi:hypothetical protein